MNEVINNSTEINLELLKKYDDYNLRSIYNILYNCDEIDFEESELLKNEIKYLIYYVIEQILQEKNIH
ncbi:hypothetical protein J2127_001052 [Methanococcus voltae]|uniref:hypothetical protein n=1 Tax=Methanococcus voltae TaxID=2188 RepID=UPI001AE17AFD|nr:hypothetical protein [Methanococcus voltae]MBP2143883.1 hypothetical protein [Methanococcus voltae]